MSLRQLSEADRDQIKLLFKDLNILFEKQEIQAHEIEDFISKLRSPETKSFIKYLKLKTKPEVALREAFFAGQSLLSRYFASEMVPEVNTGDGFVDYKLFSGHRFVLIELKPLFEAVKRQSKSETEITKLKQHKLNWEDHKPQIFKYINQGGEFIVITDLKDWYFFDDSVSIHNCKPFHHTDLQTLHHDFEIVGNFYRVIERYNDQYLHEELDQNFFRDLDIWLNKLLEVEYNVDEKDKVALVIGIINKFIFIKTLDDLSVIDFKWLQKRWENSSNLWGDKYFDLLKQFFTDTITWFLKYYDTDLFVKNEMDYLKNEEANVIKFYSILKQVLGFEYEESHGGQRGIIQYKFKFIDEDIFGKAYETYLAKIRHDDGIYYTPKYITKYIVEKTVGRLFDSKILNFKEQIKKENFVEAAKYLSELTSIKVLDPATGSGSFLVKALHIIWERYDELKKIINDLLKKYDVYDGITRDQKIENKVSQITNLKKILGFKSSRQLISLLLLRHLYGNDLDPRAIATTKLNLWLEAIKISPIEFRFDKLPSGTTRILPYLDMNLGVGNSVVGIPEKEVIKILEKNHLSKISTLSKLRDDYLNNPTDQDLVQEIIHKRDQLKNELLDEFVTFLNKNKIPNKVLTDTIPLYWPLEFWYFYFVMYFGV